MNDWRELLLRIFDGETLSPAEVEALCAALDEEANREEASAWMQFEQVVSDHWKHDTQITPARERLLAKALLREKHAEMLKKSANSNDERNGERQSEERRGQPQRAASREWLPQTGRARAGWLCVGTIAVLLIAILFAPPQGGREDAYAAPVVRGDFHILGPAIDLSRGDRFVSGGEGAELALGGYCNVHLVSHTEVTLRGEPHSEAIELHQGSVQARITPDQGTFRVLTPLGPVEVQGTEFETTVEYPNGLPGDLSMNGTPKKVLVTVAVLSGAVLCQLGDSPVLLEEGANRAFAGEAEGNRTQGEVTAITDFSVTLKTKGEAATFHAAKTNKLTVHEIGQLRKGDKITISWAEEEGKKWVRDIDGEGVSQGKVTALGDAWIEVQIEGGDKLKYRAPWRGGNPVDGGGPDKEVVQKLGAVRVGDQVAVTWAMPEGKRVLDVSVRGKRKPPAEAKGNQEDLTKAPPELYGLSGRVVGRLVGKDVEKGELTLKVVKVDRVWRGNKAKNPKSAEGRTLKIDGVFGKFLDVLLTLDNGDGVQIEVKHVRGDGLTFLGEELKKVTLEPEPKETPDKPETGADANAPAGLSGFRGILIGKLIKKDVEKGTLVFEMEKVKRVWKANKAPAPEKSVGKELNVEGIAGKFLDTLLVLEVGDRIEVEAFHVRGQTLKFPGEWLKKAEP